MNTQPTVFAQIMSFLPLDEFRKCVRRYQGDYRVRRFSCLDQFFCLAFAQLTYRESLRDIVSCLQTMRTRLYHMGIRGRISRNNLANANEARDWRIYADFAQVLIAEARRLYRDEDIGLELQNTVYAFDSTTINVCLSLFPWAQFQKRQGAIKLHTLLDLRGSIPSFIQMTDGLTHDVRILDDLPIEPASFYILDRGYLDFSRLYTLHEHRAFFVIRSKSNIRSRRLYSRPVDKTTDLISDQTIALTGLKSQIDYPEHLRRVRFYDRENNHRLTFLTNNFLQPALTIAQLYKLRWQVELFFRWIKQNLRIKSFYGTSENAVRTQIWVAMTVYALVAIIKKRLTLELPLYNFLQILSVTAFEKVPLNQLLTNLDDQEPTDHDPNQLVLFNL
ncbi:MAG: IS4 family transposase [Acidobacteria bacterium]|nr:IS4 family transposase [Acidobacteriota bacterium]MBE3129458.1 IS4 family transposase [Acidobacteriota bacterium]